MSADMSPSHDRVNFVYRSGVGGEEKDIELPFRILVVGDFAGHAEDFAFEKPIKVDRNNLNQVIASLGIRLELRVDDCLPGETDQYLAVSLGIASMADFDPERIIAQVPLLQDLVQVRQLLEDARDQQLDAGRMEACLGGITNREAVLAFLSRNNLDVEQPEKADPGQLSALVLEIEHRIGEQLDQILHHEAFTALESAWRSLLFLLENTVSDSSCSMELLSVGKEALIADFEDVPEITHSRLFAIVYSSEFGQFGGHPYGAIIADYEFGIGARDVKLAQNVAAIARMAHAPFIAAASPGMFDIDSMSALPRIRDFASIMEQERFARWNSFRDSEDARFFALTVPRFLLRKGWGSHTSVETTFNYRERASKGRQPGVWGNSAFAFATRLTDSFAKYRWCTNITGEEEGRVAGLHMDKSDGAVNSMRIPTEVLVSERQERELIAHGFIPLSIHKGSDKAAFFSSNSVVGNKAFSGGQRGREAALNHYLGGQLQYMFITCRIAHYLKMMQREHIGSWKNSSDVERELNEWLRQYISDMDNPSVSIRSRRPLRRARVQVNDLQDKHDWYVISMLITPHLRYMGASFTLEETGRLEKN